MEMNILEAIKSGLCKSLKEAQRNAVESYLSSQYLFVYSRSGFFVLSEFNKKIKIVVVVVAPFEKGQPFVPVV